VTGSGAAISADLGSSSNHSYEFQLLHEQSWIQKL